MGGRDPIRDAVAGRDVRPLLAALKGASDAEEDLGELVTPERDAVLSLLFGGLPDEKLHDSCVLFLSKICARDRSSLARVFALLKGKDARAASGAAAVVATVCARNPKLCQPAPRGAVASLRALLSNPAREDFHDDRSVRPRAVEALGALGDAAAVPVLVSALGDEDDAVAEKAKYSLVGMRTQARVLAEVTRLLSPAASAAPVSRALWVVNRMALSGDADESSFSPLLPDIARVIASKDDAIVQWRAASAAVAIDRAKGVRAIAGLLAQEFGSRNERAWRNAVSALSRLAESGYPAARDEIRRFVSSQERLPEEKRRAAYGEARFALDVLEASACE